ncbi:Peroxidasin-like protein [Acropora cervicornis]|uniref:Peroxidasin-like protein n=1 Tax=Acropora cervicornis TaxID=6130 RepID=A0AAD9QAY6_ACRCE|nr:Peroxidasin-like protein [Acropora cervicornis]
MTVNESKTASFQCSVSGNPKPVSTWSKLEGKSGKILSATTDGKLILPDAAGSDSGVYKCSASNILGQAQALVWLVVTGKFPFANRSSQHFSQPGPRHAIQGSNVTLLICHMPGYSTPVTCSAENLLGKVQKKTVLVVVSFPRLTSKPPSKIVSMLSSTVRLNCSATGDTQPTINWRKQGGVSWARPADQWSVGDYKLTTE